MTLILKLIWSKFFLQMQLFYKVNQILLATEPMSDFISILKQAYDW